MKRQFTPLMLLALMSGVGLQATGNQMDIDVAMGYIEQYQENPNNVSQATIDTARTTLYNAGYTQEAKQADATSSDGQQATSSDRKQQAKWWATRVGAPVAAAAFTVGVAGLAYYLKPDLMQSCGNAISDSTSYLGNCCKSVCSKIAEKTSSITHYIPYVSSQDANADVTAGQDATATHEANTSVSETTSESGFGWPVCFISSMLFYQTHRYMVMHG